LDNTQNQQNQHNSMAGEKENQDQLNANNLGDRDSSDSISGAPAVSENIGK